MRLAILLALAACAARPQAVEPVARAETPWCFSVSMAWDGRTEQGEACAVTKEVCESVQRRARKWGGMAGIKGVSACRAR